MISRYASLRQGLVGAWCPSLGASGFRLIDRSGYNNHGVLTGMDPGTDWVASGSGLALDFDGVNDYVDCGTVKAFPQNNWTLCAWAMLRVSSQRGIIATGTNAGTRTQIHMFFFNATTLSFRLVNDDHDISGLPNMLNNMQHISWTFNANNFGVCYLNGKQIGSKQYSGPFTGTTDFFLGRGQGPTNRLLDGQLDDIRLYSRALTPYEIQLLYTGGRGVGLAPERIKHRRKTTAAAFNRRRRILIGASQ
jgi:hypothetical protein